MFKFALIGERISHSLSPTLFKAAGYPAHLYSYNLIDTPSLEKGVEYLLNKGYSGANITAPFKEQALSFCKVKDRSVESTGAANLILNRDGLFHCYNTDIKGAIEPVIKRGIAPTTVLVVGSGGAAKAAILAYKLANFKVVVTARDSKKIEQLVDQFQIESIELSALNSSLIVEFPLIIYTVPTLIESFANIELHKSTIFEANYREPTLKNVKCKEYIGGEEWLLFQAVEGFQLMTNMVPNIDSMWKMIDRG